MRLTTIIAFAYSMGTSLPSYAFPLRSSHTLSYYHNVSSTEAPLKNVDSESLQALFLSITHTLVGEDKIAFLGFNPTFRVVDSPWPNAFARGKSEIVMTTALLETVRDDKEIAFVIAHELGHLRLGHTSGAALVQSTMSATFAHRENEADCFAHNLLKDSPIASSNDGVRLLNRIIGRESNERVDALQQFPTLGERLDHLIELAHLEAKTCVK